MAEPGREYKAGSGYRYGFNGQEKSTEIQTGGNNYTAEFWEYDGRIGRRWNVDPVLKIHESPYVAFADNPIWLNDENGTDTTKSASGSKNGDILAATEKALGYQKDKPIELLQRAINYNMEGVQATKNKAALNFNQFVNGEINEKVFNVLNSQYQKEIGQYEKGVSEGIALLYKWTKADQKYIDVHNNIVTARNALYAQVAFEVMSFGTETPGAVSSGVVINRASLFSLREGYGIFGKNGLKIGSYKIEAMYSGRVYGTGTILSIKQVGREGGNLIRWDYGVLHGSQTMGLHSTFRLNMLGKTFGSTKQLPWHAPFRFWNYVKP